MEPGDQATKEMMRGGNYCVQCVYEGFLGPKGQTTLESSDQLTEERLGRKKSDPGAGDKRLRGQW